jgi:hypothetical protein
LATAAAAIGLSPQMIYVTVFGYGNQPCSKGRATAGIKPFNVSYHLQKGLLCQILAERFILCSFQKKAGNVIVVQPNQLVKRRPVSALASFDQGFFIHRFLLLLGFIYLHAKNARRLVLRSILQYINMVSFGAFQIDIFAQPHRRNRFRIRPPGLYLSVSFERAIQHVICQEAPSSLRAIFFAESPRITPIAVRALRLRLCYSRTFRPRLCPFLQALSICTHYTKTKGT